MSSGASIPTVVLVERLRSRESVPLTTNTFRCNERFQVRITKPLARSSKRLHKALQQQYRNTARSRVMSCDSCCVLGMRCKRYHQADIVASMPIMLIMPSLEGCAWPCPHDVMLSVPALHELTRLGLCWQDESNWCRTRLIESIGCWIRSVLHQATKPYLAMTRHPLPAGHP